MCHQPQPPQPSSGCAMVESVDDAEGLSVAVERCPLCSTSRRRLTCARCVQAGDFVYFSGRNAERLEVFPPPSLSAQTGLLSAAFTITFRRF